MLNFGEIIVIMKSDVANFCQHFDFSQDSSKPLRLSLQTKARESTNVRCFRHKSFAWINQTTRTNRAKSLRADLLWAVGGQHKNYPIINNITEQREQASLKGPSLHVDHLKRKATFTTFISFERGRTRQPRKLTRSVISLTFPVGISFRYLCKENEGSWERLVVSYL